MYVCTCVCVCIYVCMYVYMTRGCNVDAHPDSHSDRMMLSAVRKLFSVNSLLFVGFNRGTEHPEANLLTYLRASFIAFHSRLPADCRRHFRKILIGSYITVDIAVKLGAERGWLSKCVRLSFSLEFLLKKRRA